ncbi:MAG: hypothetical protein LBS74_07855 [Oscillospiraceae bacterium]|jgi:predicted Fe-Mo cluster-binding NifX family protein|nr:hypothetical protein [Oscillospiraceae bacterium]
MKYNIAITTKTGEEVDLHFGQADVFSVYSVDSATGEYSLAEKREVLEEDFMPDEEGSPNPKCSACHEERVEYISNLLHDCAYLLVGKIGPKPHRILLRNGVNALEVPYLSIDAAIAKLNEYVNRQKRAGE